MTDGEPEPVPPEFDIPEGLSAGVYANALLIWHTAHEFTLDFGVFQRRAASNDEEKPPVRLVSRVRMPVTLILDVLRALNVAMTQYERRFGEIRQPEERNG